jgi:hypothetical protein
LGGKGSGAKKKHKNIAVSSIVDRKAYSREYYRKRTAPLNHGLNSYVVDFSPPKTHEPKRKNPWSF